MTGRTRTRLSEADRKTQIIDAAGIVARRDGLEATTVRAVATEAGVSHGLVLHHFGSMEELHSNLLDALLHTVLVPQTDGLEVIPDHDRLMSFLTRQLAWLGDHRDAMDLLFEYWLRGTRDQSIRDRIRHRLEEFREAIEPITARVMASDPARFRDTSATALAIAVGDLVLGHEIQQQLHPDIGGQESLLAAVRALLQADQKA